MSKGKELAKNTAIITIGKLCTQFLSFILLPLYTAVLSTSEYGTVDLLMTVQQLLVYICFLQIEQSLFRFLIDFRKNKNQVEKIITSCTMFSLIQCVLLFIIFIVLDLIFTIDYIYYLYFYVVVVIFSSENLQIARGLGRNSIYAIGSFISAISSIIFNIFFLVGLKIGIQGMLLSYILGNLLCVIYIFLKLKIFSYIEISKFSLTSMKEYLHYSIPLVPNAISWWIMNASDRIIVGTFLGTSATGLLTVAHKFPSAYSLFFTSFNLSWTESASLHIEDSDVEIFFSTVINRVFNLFFSIGLLIIAILPFIFKYFVNVNFYDAYYQVPIYMGASMAQVFLGLYSVVYIALKKTKEISKSTVVSALINLVFNIMFIKYIGLYAASLSSFFAFCIVAIWRYFDSKKYIKIKLDLKSLYLCIVIYIIETISYYGSCRLFQIITFIICLIFVIYLNKSIILQILKSPKQLKQNLFK